MVGGIGVGKHLVILMLIVVSMSIIPHVNAQLAPELIPSDQICEQMEISNRLYNPVTIIMGYDKATIRTPEVIVSKSNPDAVVPIQILDTNLNMNTNSTGRFVAKVDMQYASPSDQPRIVTYAIISGKGGIELERGTWLVDGKGFCKVITFTVSEEPHIPTNEEFAAQAKEITAVALKANTDEQRKTNDISTFEIFAIVGLMCAILVGKVISILMVRHDTITAKRLLDILRRSGIRLDDANKNLKLSREFNDLLNEGQRQKESQILVWFEKSLPRILSQVTSQINDSIKNMSYAVDHAIKNNQPLKFEPKPVEIVLEPMPNKIPTKVKNQTEYPKFVKDGIILLDRGIEMIPENIITNKLQDIIKPKSEPETFEEWFEFYNKIGSRDDLLKEYETLKEEYENDKTNLSKEARARGCYWALIGRESKLDK